MKSFFIPFVASLLVLSSCIPPPKTEEPTSVPSQEGGEVEDQVKGMPIIPEEGEVPVVEKIVEQVREEEVTVPEVEATYAMYEEGVIGGGEKVVLFFKAAWCPKCRDADVFLQGLYEAGGQTLSTYIVDYDTALELKKKYGVVQQHTFVKVNGQGEKIGLLSFPDHEALRVFLSQ